MNRRGGPERESGFWQQLWLRRLDQVTVAILVLLGFAGVGWNYWHWWAISQSVVDIERAEPGSIRFVVDVNTAPSVELEVLPGIGPHLAQEIVAYRLAHGRFRELDDLLAVPGIGTGKLAAVRPYLLPLDDPDEGVLGPARD